jgi:hypothetical protein
MVISNQIETWLSDKNGDAKTVLVGFDFLGFFIRSQFFRFKKWQQPKLLPTILFIYKITIMSMLIG